MSSGIRGSILVAAAAFASFVVAAVPRALAQDTIVKVDGSSTVYPITEAVAEDFQKANKGVKVTVGVSGSGGGFKKFVRGELDITNSSRPITQSEADDAAKNGIEYIELPIAFDALTVVINKQNTWATSMTVDELKKLWEPASDKDSKRVTKWSDIRAGWPDSKIELYGPGTDSGTFDYFTEAIVGKAKSSRGDYTASEDDNTLVKGVEGNKNALGYFGYAYYISHQKRLKAVDIQWDKNPQAKTPVGPSKETVVNGSYAPLSRPLFLYVNKKSLLSQPHVKMFTEYYLKNAAKLSEEVRYIPLPAKAYEFGQKRLDTLKTGSVFLGHEHVGLNIEDVLAREEK